MEIHQVLTRSDIISNVLHHHKQGGIFAAEGYDRPSGALGCALPPLALGLLTIIAITGQVPRRMIRTEAFQETPIVEVTRSVTKHNYLVLDVEDIPRIAKEAMSGSPGPVLIAIAKDIQQQLAMPNWNQRMQLPAYIPRLPRPPRQSHLEQVVQMISESKRPVLYVGHGCLNSSKELRKFVDLTGVPVASTLMGLGSFPCSDDLSLNMFSMHVTMYTNYAVDNSDLLRVIQLLDELTNGGGSGIGQHHMWVAQFYNYRRPRQWLTSSGLGGMGFGLPAVIGAAVAKLDATVVDINGDGSFITNVQELVTARVKNLPVKILHLNDQHLGMVVQWEDWFYKANRAHTYLSMPGRKSEIFPNFLKFPVACDIPAARVSKKAIPVGRDSGASGARASNDPQCSSIKDMIVEGDGRSEY